MGFVRVTKQNLVLIVMTKQIKIVQTSCKHTGTTILTNLLYGFICPSEPVHYQKSVIGDSLIALERVVNMNKRYEEIKTKPFSFIDHFYELHGSHRKVVNHSPEYIRKVKI